MPARCRYTVIRHREVTEAFSVDVDTRCALGTGSAKICPISGIYINVEGNIFEITGGTRSRLRQS